MVAPTVGGMVQAAKFKTVQLPLPYLQLFAIWLRIVLDYINIPRHGRQRSCYPSIQVLNLLFNELLTSLAGDVRGDVSNAAVRKYVITSSRRRRCLQMRLIFK